MRCTSVEQNECWKGVDLECIDHSIRLIHDILHTDMVDMTPLEWVGLAPIVFLGLRAFICIVPHLVALEAFHLTDVLLDVVVVVVVAMVAMVASIASTTILTPTVVLMAIPIIAMVSSIVVPFMVRVHLLV
jgi:hypothetical protein